MDTILIIEHRSRSGHTFIWLLDDQSATTIAQDLARYSQLGLIDIDEGYRICDRVRRAMVRI